MSDSSLPDGIPEWVAVLRERYGLAAEQLPADAVLRLAGVAAHAVARPAAPITAFVAGLVAGTRGGTGADVEALIGELAEAARAHERADGSEGGDR